jgi:hypothetical protein
MKLGHRFALCSVVSFPLKGFAMRIFPLVAGSAAMVWISAVSCSAPSTGTGGDATTALVNKFCTDVAAAYCESDWSCCLQPGTHLGENVNDCKQKFGYPKVAFCDEKIYSDRADLEASLRAGTTIFDQAQLDTCLTLLRSMAAGGTACVEPPWNVIKRSCLSAFRGQLPPGTPCTWPESTFAESIAQCKDGRCESGKCVPFLKLGDPCSAKMVIWTDAASKVCNYTNYEWCRGPLLDGGTGDAGDMGTCAPMGNIGDACDPKNEEECRGRTCDDATGKCVLPDPYTTECGP